MTDTANATGNKSAAEGTPLLEWIAGATGAALFATALAVTVINGFSQSQPPDISVRAAPARALAQGYLVEFEARNSGDETAGSVRFAARLTEKGETVETREAEIDFLPPHATRRGGVFFTRDPAGLDLVIEAEGYEAP